MLFQYSPAEVMSQVDMMTAASEVE